ncbi:MAG: phage integrase N-terminal SAM-like domain-containing protein [Gammaproteobacteria bacterium]|nr:phage integrase N-terminal SAM-like domain-containing protein [Gammaproteobacteria bacterium]
MIDQVKAAIRVRHYSRKTEKAYCYWSRLFIRFHHYRHPSEMSEPEVSFSAFWISLSPKNTHFWHH